MPPQLDLTGRKFGLLTVLCRNGTVKFGRLQAAWLCRCECGEELTVAQNRLPHRASIPAGHVIDRCETCRSKPCVICGAPIPARVMAATCSPECAQDHKRAKWRGYYHQYASDPAWRLSRLETVKRRRLERPPEEATEAERRRYKRRLLREGREKIRQDGREMHAARMQRPGYAARRRARQAAWIEQNRPRARTYSREYARRKRAQDALREMARSTQEMTEGKRDE